MNIIKDADVLSVENLFKDKYIIPLYQRNFAWGEEQISRLLQDIYESYYSTGDQGSLECGSYYIDFRVSRYKLAHLR